VHGERRYVHIHKKNGNKLRQRPGQIRTSVVVITAGWMAGEGEKNRKEEMSVTLCREFKH